MRPLATRDMEIAFLEFMAETGHADMYSCAMDLEMALEWASDPQRAVAAIAALHTLYVKILRLCPYGVLPRETMKTALCNLDDRIFGGIFRERFFKKWNHDNRPSCEVANAIVEILQAGVSTLQELD